MTAATITALERRAACLAAGNPVYADLIAIHLPLFRAQILWRRQVDVAPATISARDWACARETATPLRQRLSSGIAARSLERLWRALDSLVREHRLPFVDVLDAAARAEARGDFVPREWLATLRPDDEGDEVAKCAAALGVAPDALNTLARTVLLPHWHRVAAAWWPGSGSVRAAGGRCPVCGGVAILASCRAVGGTPASSTSATPTRWLHCGFCDTAWAPSALACPACGSSAAGDARYFFCPGTEGPRLDFCGACRAYLKVIPADGAADSFPVALEALVTLHLDPVALDRGLVTLRDYLATADATRQMHPRRSPAAVVCAKGKAGRTAGDSPEEMS